MNKTIANTVFKYFLAGMALSVPLTSLNVKAQNPSKTWNPNLKNGMYRNPVIDADYSDPDVCRVGNDYYMTSSSFQCFPGLQILHSTDLVNWEIIGAALLDDYPVLPVIQGRFEINNGASVSIDNVVLDGSENVSADQAFNFKTADATYGKVIIKNSEIKNFDKGVFYVNVACTINELTFKNCLIHDIKCDGGDMFDCRKGRIDNLNLLESTIYNSAASRDFIRMDDASALGGAPVITVNKCTIDGASNGGKRLLYVRYVGNVINWTNNIVSNTGAVWSNQSKTGVPTFQNNVYFNCAKLKVADVEGKTNMFADEAGKVADPEYKNAAKGDFTIGNESVKKLGVGDPRW